MSSHEHDTPTAEAHNRTQVQQLPEATSSDDVNSTSPNFGTFTGPSVPGYPFLSQPQASGEIGRLGDYRVLAKLGEGGMGFVFRAEDPALKRFVALKVMRPEVAAKPLAADRFLREGRAAAGLKSDHIITIYQVGQANGAPFIAMEYLEGIALDEWMKQQKKSVPVPHVLRVVRDTLRGLATAHDKGLIHRDIKPANLWIEKGSARIKVLDFGLTRGMDGNDQMTADGAVVGTPAYMAPEQAAGKPVDPRADLFSVGTVMYQLFLGINPFVRSNMMATMGAVTFDVQPPVIALRPEVPQAYSDYLDRLLAKDPAGRPANAKAALAELAAIEKSLQDKAKTSASTSNLPVVSMMAPAAAMPAQVWGDLTESDDTVVRTSMSDPETPRKPPSKKLLIGSGLFAFFALLLGGIVIIITNKDGTKTKVEVPDGATVDVQKGGKSVANFGGKRAEVAKANVVMDADRNAAEFVLKRGGYVVLVGGMRIDDAKKLPAESFKIAVASTQYATIPLTDADLEQFRRLDALIELHINGTVSDAGLAKLAEFPAAANIYLLHLNSPEMTDAAMSIVTKFPNLTHLHIHGPKVTGGVLNYLNKTKLRLLGLNRSKLTDADLPKLKGFPELIELHLGGSSVTDEGMKVIGELSRLTSFAIHDSPNVTDAGVKHLAALRNLAHLNIGSHAPDGGPLTSAAFETVGTLTELKMLLARGRPPADADLKFLAGLQKLEALHINSAALTDAGLEHLAKLKALKELSSLKGAKVTAAGVKKFRAALPECKVESDFDIDPDRRAAEYVLLIGGVVRVDGQEQDVKGVADLPKTAFTLTSVNLEGNKLVTDEGMAAFKDCKNILSLNLGLTQVSDAGLANFKGCQLTSLELSGNSLITDAGMANFKECKKLGLLSLRACLQIGDAGLAHIGEFRSVQSVNIAGTRVTEKSLAYFQGSDQLQSFDADTDLLGANTLAVIASCPNLQIVVLTGDRVVIAGLAQFKNCAKLDAMYIFASRLTNADLLPFKNCTTLKLVQFRLCPQITEAVLEHFANCLELIHIDFSESPLITDASLEKLSQRKTLKSLNVRATKVTIEGVKKFKTALPECKVESDFDAVLDPDRKAAEYVLSIGGVVRVDGQAQDVKAVADLPKTAFTLTCVDLRGNKLITDEGMAAFKGCKDILILNLGHTQVSDAALAHFRECKNLQELLLHECPLVGDAALANFKGCQLTSLSLNGNSLVTDTGMANFKECKKLEMLSLWNCSQISDTGLAHIGEFRKVYNVGIAGTRVTEKSLAYFQGSDQLRSFAADTDLLGENALAVIASCPNLQIVSVTGDRVGIAGLAQFKNCAKLENMFIYASSLTNADLLPFKNCTTLKLVQFRVCPQITEAVLEHFANCLELIHIDFSESPLITDASLEKLAQRKTLKTLGIRGTKVTVEGVKKFRAALPECKVESDFDAILDPDRKAAEYVLSIGGTVRVDGQAQDIKGVADLPKTAFTLTSVNLEGNKLVTDEGMSAFMDCKNILILDLFNAQVSDAGLANLKNCKNLDVLNLSKTKVSDTGLMHFQECKVLKHLHLNDTQVGDKGLAHFKGCEKLMELHLDGTQVSDTGLEYFKDCTNIRGLSLSKTKVTDAGLAYFRHCKSLGGFGARGTQITDAGLINFKDCKSIVLLSLGSTRVTDAGLAIFKEHKNLSHVRLDQTQISDAGLASLKNSEKLELLSLTTTIVSDAGMVHLKDFKNLKELNLQQTKVTAAKVDELKKALPQCKIGSDFPE